MNPFASIILVGEELLDGRTADIHGPFLASEVARMGGQVAGMRIVADDAAKIGEALDAAGREAKVILVAGGLGPTPDDLTREALAAWSHRPLREDETALAALRARYASFGREMPPQNAQQARRPEGAAFITNPIGTAPGIHLEHEGLSIFLMPGVPHELRRMWEVEVRPQLEGKLGGGYEAIRRLRLAGVGESNLAMEVREGLGGDSEGILYCVGRFGIDLILRGRAEEVQQWEGKLRARLAKHIYGDDDRSLPAVILDRLAERGETLAVAESCTGGMLGAALSEIPGSSSVFLGGIISYSNRVKEEQLAVPSTMLAEFGAVSEEVAAAMAAGVQKALGADWTLSITGIAGPGGGSEAKPVGTVCFGLQAPKATALSRRHLLAGDRSQVRRRSVATALELLRAHLS